MIKAVLYQTVYLLIVAYFTIRAVSLYGTRGCDNKDRGVATNQKLTLFLAVFMIVFIGLRPSSYVFADMYNYVDYFRAIRAGTYRHGNENFIWDPLFDWFGNSGLSDDYFFCFIAFIYFGGIFWTCKKIFPNDLFLSYIVYLGAFSTFSYATNGIKAGAAASFFLLALAYREKKWKAALFLYLSLGFHHAMLSPIAAYLVTFLVKNRKYYLYGWIACFIMAALHITIFQTIFAGYADEGGAGYLSLSNTEKHVSGFRPDFIFYSAIPIFLGEYLVRKFHIRSEKFDFLWKVYVAENAVFLLCTYASYINRIAYLSWLMYPIVLIYPFINANLGKNQYRYLKYAVYGHLGFTLFMSFIYYG